MASATTSTRGPANSATEGREFRRGDRVRVRPPAQILETLDENGDLDRLPFMPEMLPLCGQTLRVSGRADKTCDTVNITGCSREMDDTVHLVEARCDGSAHGGCQAGCLFFLKEAWLESADAPAPTPLPGDGEVAAAEAALRDRLAAHTQSEPEVYRCQATQLPDATRPMAGLRHYVRDVQTRNVPAPLLLRGLAISLFDRYQTFSRHRLPTWLRIGKGEELPNLKGRLTTTPRENLDLQPGEIVEVKNLAEIVDTLSVNQRNRSLWFDREMVRYCGKRFRVLRRVDRLLDEKTGRMIEVKTPSIILEGGVCVGDFHKLCPRQDYAFFREIWLRRVGDSVPSGTQL